MTGYRLRKLQKKLTLRVFEALVSRWHSGNQGSPESTPSREDPCHADQIASAIRELTPKRLMRS